MGLVMGLVVVVNETGGVVGWCDWCVLFLVVGD
jgi:hypothetical protein